MKNSIRFIFFEIASIYNFKRGFNRILFFWISSFFAGLIFTLFNATDVASPWFALFLSTINIIYAPHMFSWNEKYWSELNKERKKHWLIIKSKILFIAISNFLNLLIISPIALIYFDQEHIIWVISIVCFNSFVHSYISSYMSILHNKNKTTDFKYLNTTFYEYIISFIPVFFFILMSIIIVFTEIRIEYIYIVVFLMFLISLLLNRIWLKKILKIYRLHKIG